MGGEWEQGAKEGTCSADVNAYTPAWSAAPPLVNTKLLPLLPLPSLTLASRYVVVSTTELVGPTAKSMPPGKETLGGSN